jgi:hypothetical protein
MVSCFVWWDENWESTLPLQGPFCDRRRTWEDRKTNQDMRIVISVLLGMLYNTRVLRCLLLKEEFYSGLGQRPVLC